MVTFVRHDLDFILQGIKVSEQHATTLDANGNFVAGTDLIDLLDDVLSPIGMRTVTGEYNNLITGQQNFGATDNVFPRLLTPEFKDAEDLSFDPDGPGPLQVGDPTSYTQTSGIVQDSSVRTISNLISDQTADNPAAVDANAGSGTDLNGSLFISNTAPDEGLSAPFNSWMTLFGQFFDHGLDLVGKGGSGAVFIPLQPDDPLYDAASPTNFMVLTRATNQPGPDGVLGTADDVREHNNSTSPFVDQNQTYTSHPSHQVFMRAYEATANGPVSTGALLEGANGGMATWADLKAQARDLLGIDLTDAHAEDVPLLATDEYGKFLAGPNGLPQVVMDDGMGGTMLVEGNLTTPISLDGALSSGQAFLADIAHNAAPVFDGTGALVPDADMDTGNAVAFDPMSGQNLEYDNELLDRHYVAGDGRVNENFGLTAVHHIFHSEHNRLVEDTKRVILETEDLDFVNEWLDVPIAALPADQTEIDALDWNGERLFQASKFGTEMQYQHLVFEEFGRKIAPFIDVFGGLPEPEVDPAIVAEFAHTVYRFGHSMLTETVDRISADGQTLEQTGLIQAFLNPVEFDKDGTMTAEEAAGAVARGMTRQVGNEIDEFITEALRSNLLGLPLDLGALNLARGRETGVPSLNEARSQFFDQTSDTQLKPYDDWLEFAQNIKNPISVVNFIAAYGTHDSITTATTLIEKRDAAMLMVFGDNANGNGAIAPADRLDYLNGEGTWAGVETGLNNVDFWIGGLAEAVQPFGGMLGSTFNFVFETQMEALQGGDRFYYLWRTQGLNFLSELEGNSLAGMIMRNTDLGELDATHLPADIFAAMSHILEIDETIQMEADPTWDDPIQQATFGDLVDRGAPGENYIHYKGGDHVVLGGSEGADTLIGGIGDDAIWGDGGDDIIEGGHGVDLVRAGDGDDIITDVGGDDNLQGGAGNDVISSGNGFDLVISGTGDDFVILGEDDSEVFLGLGNDFALGNSGFDTFFGGEGDDWIEGGGGVDLMLGDNGDFLQAGQIQGHDVLIGGTGSADYDGEGGDDIMFQDIGVAETQGFQGFDWATHQGQLADSDTDLQFRVAPAPGPVEDTLADRFELVEGASGWIGDDILRGDSRNGDTVDADGNPLPIDEFSFTGHELNEEGIARITGLSTLLTGATGFSGIAFTGGNILIGGDGNDIIEGRGGDDVIDGDAQLNVQIGRVDINGDIVERGDRMEHFASRMLDGTINPGELTIIREIVYDDTDDGNVDTAVFSGNLADYDIGDVTGDGVRYITDNRVVFPDAAFGSDGTDTIRNIERLQFADQTIVIEGDNAPGTGSVDVSDTTPTEGEEITAENLVLMDANGILPGSTTYQWQVFDGAAWFDIAGATAISFTPGDLEAGFSLRVVVGFTDGLGVPEMVFSAPTAAVIAVNDAPTDIVGTLTVDENALDGTNVGAVAAVDPDSTAFTYSLADDAGGRFAINAANGAVTVADRMGIDFEQATSHTIRVSVNDGDNVLEKDFIVDVTDEAPESVTGDGRDNTILAAAGNDHLDGLAGADTLAAGLGDDVYFVDQLGDSVIELAGEGNDTVIASGDFTLGATQEVEVLRASESGGGIALSGNELNNRLISSSNADVLSGGVGDDVFMVNSTGATLLEGWGEGYDRAFVSTDFTLGAGQEVEYLRAFNMSGGITLGGNEFGNRLVSSSFDDVLSGGAGNDVFIVNGPGDTVLEATGEGNDRVFTSADFTLDAGQEVEVLQAHNAGGGIALGGNEFNNQLVSSTFDDAMSGGAGNDAYIVNSTGDTVFEAVGEGLDRVIASADFTLGAGQEVELLYASNTGGGISLTGNEFANRFFSSGLDDIMSGGAGDDAFFVNDTGDTVLEAAGEGSDRVVASVDFTLGAGQEIEGLYASQTGGGVALSGNELDNRIVGNAADNTIEGGVGSDLMTGAGGSDVFVFSSGSGADTITDFDSDAVGGQDLLDISALGVTDASFSTDVTISQSGARTILEIGAETVNLNNTVATSIDQTDFLLAM